jgi:transcriptional regulator GlxA family with amidase domain
MKLRNAGSLSLAALLCVTPSPKAVAQQGDAGTRKKNVAILVYNNVELLDFAGPGEVFRAAGDGEAFNVFTVAATADPILSFGFVTVTPQYSIENSPEPDILVVPGGNSNVPLKDPKLMAWIDRVTQHTEIAFSVCSGAFVLARLGLLEGRSATTHWASVARLRSSYPGTIVLENRRFVDEDSVVTTAGVSAGIDGALHIVDRLLGRTAAEKTARYMEYEWRPDTAAWPVEPTHTHVP